MPKENGFTRKKSPSAAGGSGAGGVGAGADIDDMFGDDELMGGDQGAPPGGEDDEFGEEELLGGDQAQPDAAPEPPVELDEDDDDFDEEAEEDGKAFLEEMPAQATKKQSVKELAR